MPPSSTPLPSRASSSGKTAAVQLFPRVFLQKGGIVFPRLDGRGFEPFLSREGASMDVFDTVDHLLARFHRLYVVDLEGVRTRRPQFEYLQEMASGKEMWVDAGARNADEVMDVLVAGASRAVLVTSTLQSAREISRSLKLTSQIALDIVVEGDRVGAADPSLKSASPRELATQARGRGLEYILLSPKQGPVDWSLVADVAAAGPTLVGGTFSAQAVSDLSTAGAVGGVFDAREELEAWTTSGS